MKLIPRIFVAIICLAALAQGNNSTKKAAPIKLGRAVEFDEKNETMVHNGVPYAKGEFFKDGDDFYAFPCNTNACIRQCSAELASKANLTLLRSDMWINVSHEGRTNAVRLHDHFHVLKEVECNDAYILDPEENDQDEHIHLANGSLFLVMEGGDSSIILGRHEYCVLVDAHGNVKSLMCAESGNYDGFPEKEIQYYIYPVFMIFSIICLLLTLLAFVFTPEMRNLHGKSIACQSFALMMAYIGLTVTYYSGTDSHLIVCKLFAYMAFGFLLSSFYWLNTMCFDIFWTFSDFKKMTGSLSQTSRKKFRMYAIHSILNPLIILTVTIILDAALDEKSSMWPGIGEVKCWFRNLRTEFMFFHIHLLIMLLANTVFFILTLVKITNMKREAQVLKRGDSMTHGAGASSALEDRQRLVLYVKLFILMGGTWVMELISWAVNSKPKWFWIPFDVINCSRGIIIFIFCVVTNQKVRNSLLRRFLPKYAPEPSSHEARSCQSKMSATSEVSDTHDTICTTTALCDTKSADTEV
ncbi:Hypothetical predicted protein [Cloeon dipterum]|uniref:G-protein coupled receptors family 2 profile 2 domain-containing protein n=1 Tax=Cloeon dipterum TaxID=197152 RepID=A0A8S1E441_9INSE|nr:Hypothetical predicted protein [Cloeon dipterum]CAB3387246.1 Hypothetical predicted protein [Cloeon dipterum]